MAEITYHDDGRPQYPERTYKCSECGRLHRYRRLWGGIPRWASPCCGAPMHRDYQGDDLGKFQMRTPDREVRFKLAEERARGERPQAMDVDLNPHIATV